MVGPIAHRYMLQRRRIHAIQTTYVVATLGRIGAPHVMRVNTASRTEVMARDARMETIGRQKIRTLDDAYTG